MINFKKSLAIILASGMIISLTACNNSKTENNGDSSSTSSVSSNANTSTETNNSSEEGTKSEIVTPNLSSETQNAIKTLRETYQYGDAEFAKIANIVNGTEKPENTVDVIMSTNKGDVTIRLFSDAAPKAVENFVTHSKNGYYDGVTFHRIIKDFMIQGGDPDGTGRGGESIWGEAFEDEFKAPYFNYRGALSMANSGPFTNGSQFFIVQKDNKDMAMFFGLNAGNNDVIDTYISNMYMKDKFNEKQALINEAIKAEKSQEEIQALADKYTAELETIQKDAIDKNGKIKAEFGKEYAPIVEYYLTFGGTPHLDNVHTVFGYVIAGMENVDTMASVVTDKDGKPNKDVIINSIKVME